ncbi:MAG: S8 family serine peptidase [Candidatus Hydrogenedentes bacterium]|nr:S8 family serine peptidase [Candidatus Hydrogenedentota bacterium]
MSTIELKYGDSTLKLYKSPALIGVQPRAKRANVVEYLAARMGARATGESLGGFELVDVESAVQPMEEVLNTLRANREVDVGTHVYYTSDDRVPLVPTGEVYIEFSKRADPKKCNEILSTLGLQIIESRDDQELIARVTPLSPNPVAVAVSLQKSGLVEVAEPDLATPGRLASIVMPSDPRLAEQWHLNNTGSINGSSVGLTPGADARVVAAWQRANSLGATQVVIAVIDNGFDFQHCDLSGPGKIVEPWDFTRNSADPCPYNGSWHGTACAGVALGNANAYGIVGAAPGCRFMPIRWGTDLSDSQFVKWFRYVKKRGAWVVSCSWAAEPRYYPLSTRKSKTIHKCATKGRNGLGCVVVFAAGNECRDVNDPAGDSVNGFAIHPDVIAVAASTSKDEYSGYSNYGNEISVCAPSSGIGGRDVLTSDVMGSLGRTRDDFNPYFGGTSCACALVAGICGLVLSVKPTLTAAQVKVLLQQTARKIGPRPSSDYDSNGHSTKFGFGCVKADAVVAALIGGGP